MCHENVQWFGIDTKQDKSMEGLILLNIKAVVLHLYLLDVCANRELIITGTRYRYSMPEWILKPYQMLRPEIGKQSGNNMEPIGIEPTTS